MTRPALTNGLLTAALVVCGLLVAALVYGFATRALAPQTRPDRAAVAAPDTSGQARALAASVGALFLRSYERGERVHLAMLSRGWTGAFPDTGAAPVARRSWATAAVLPTGGALVCAAAWAGA